MGHPAHSEFDSIFCMLRGHFARCPKRCQQECRPLIRVGFLAAKNTLISGLAAETFEVQMLKDR